MKYCIRARVAVAHLQRRGAKPDLVSIVIPWRWSRSTFLRYVRERHPKETARIAKWPEDSLWLANPADFSNYAYGVKA